MSDKKVYIVYRRYSKKERPDPSTRNSLYGWSYNKNIIKAFLSQRSKDKYDFMKIYIESDTDMDDYELDTSNMIDYIKLKSVTTGEDYPLFLTSNEMQEAEIRIQRYFRELCSIDNIKGKGDYLNMIINIEDYYKDALEFIGYRPPELSAIFDSVDPRQDPGDIYGITELIEEAYWGCGIHPFEEMDRDNPTLPGLMMISDVASKIIYSIESFIKVLREEL